MWPSGWYNRSLIITLEICSPYRLIKYSMKCDPIFVNTQNLHVYLSYGKKILKDMLELQNANKIICFEKPKNDFFISIYLHFQNLQWKDYVWRWSVFFQQRLSIPSNLKHYIVSFYNNICIAIHILLPTSYPFK